MVGIHNVGTFSVKYYLFVGKKIKIKNCCLKNV